MKGRVSNELATSPPGSAETNSRAFGGPIDLSIINPTLNEGPNLMLLLPQLRAEVKSLEVSSEILIVTREIDPETATAAEAAGAIVLKQRERGYGGALITAFHAARRAYLLTMDADLLCSRVIEDVPKGSPILGELERVLASGGRLVLETPDYAKWEWVITKKLCDRLAPGAREHISHYSRSELVERFESRGFKLEAVRHILRSELILAFRKL